jgi:predicted short-subunit dehydrogenase-like oxidoreductase (DUF2520 family)
MSVPPETTTSKKPRLAEPLLHVVGAGAAGTGLARRLCQSGWPVGAVLCRTAARAVERQALIGAGSPAALDDWLRDPGNKGQPALLMISVPDRTIGDVAELLAREPWPSGSLALHLSGSVEIDALEPLARAGLHTGGLHPLKSFVDPEQDADSLAGTVFAIEGDPVAMTTAEQMVAACEGIPFALAPGGRPSWHAAATHAANHLVALVDQSLDLAEQAGLDRVRARAALLPLLQGTLANLARHDPVRALTGPVARGDTIAVEKHLTALAELPADVRAAYQALGLRALRLAVEAGGLSPDGERSLHALLGGEPA